MTLALLGGDVAERLTDRDWPESTAGTTSGLGTTLSEGVRARRFRYGGGEIVFTVNRSTPEGVISTIRALSDLLSLPENWDSYGARRIDPSMLPSVLRLMLDVMQDGTPVPAVVPTSRGGVQLEWHTRGIDLEVEFISPTRLWGSYEDARFGQGWEKDLTVDLTPLSKAIAELTDRTS